VIGHDITTTVGNTPMVELARVGQGLPGRLLAKLEMRNPLGSVKDRVGLALRRRGTPRRPEAGHDDR
jgi:cysteine synthase